MLESRWEWIHMISIGNADSENRGVFCTVFTRDTPVFASGDLPSWHPHESLPLQKFSCRTEIGNPFYSFLRVEGNQACRRTRVGAPRFELGTSCSQSRRANQAALRPDMDLVQDNRMVCVVREFSSQPIRCYRETA